MRTFYTDVIKQDIRFSSRERINDMNLLAPKFRAKVQKLIALAKAEGVELIVFETYRSQHRQTMLYERKATKLKKVGVHAYGLAVDIVKGFNGKVTSQSWAGDFSIVGRLAKKVGIKVWGGDWKGFVDSCHVQDVTVEEQKGLFAGTFYPKGELE